MKPAYYVMLLLGALACVMAGCSEKLNQVAGPNDPVTAQPAPLAKNITQDFTWDVVSTSTINPGIQKFPDGKMIVRGRMDNATFDASTDLLDGYGVVELNGKADMATGTGEFWGKLTLTTTKPAAGGGVWEMNWHGKGVVNPSTGMWEIPLKQEGYGKGGTIQGMHCFCTHVITGTLDFSAWTGHAEGYLKTH